MGSVLVFGFPVDLVSWGGARLPQYLRRFLMISGQAAFRYASMCFCRSCGYWQLSVLPSALSSGVRHHRLAIAGLDHYEARAVEG